MIIFLKWLKVVCHVWKHLPQQNTPCLILLRSLLIVSEDKDCFCTARIRQWTRYSYGFVCIFRIEYSVLYTASFFYNWHKKINNLWGNFITDQAGVSKMTFPTSIPGRFKSTQYLKSRLQAEGSRSFCSEAHLTLPP